MNNNHLVLLVVAALCLPSGVLVLRRALGSRDIHARNQRIFGGAAMIVVAVGLLLFVAQRLLDA